MPSLSRTARLLLPHAFISTNLIKKEVYMNNGFSKSKKERSHLNFIMSTSGGIRPSAAVTVKRLASLIADKQGTSYSVVLNVLRCQLSFSLVDPAIMCIRGGRSSFKNPAREQIARC